MYGSKWRKTFSKSRDSNRRPQKTIQEILKQLYILLGYQLRPFKFELFTLYEFCNGTGFSQHEFYNIFHFIDLPLHTISFNSEEKVHFKANSKIVRISMHQSCEMTKMEKSSGKSNQYIGIVNNFTSVSLLFLECRIFLC